MCLNCFLVYVVRLYREPLTNWKRKPGETFEEAHLYMITADHYQLGYLYGKYLIYLFTFLKKKLAVLISD